MLRWSAVGTGSAAAFVLSWWVCQQFIGVDEGSALGVAGAVLAIVLAVGGWWAAKEAPSGLEGPGGAAPRQDVHAGHDALTAGRDLTVHYHAVTVGDLEAGGGPTLTGAVPQQPPGFQEREDLLAMLDAPGAGVLVVAALAGMRGVGKTQLAAAYARAKLAAGWRLVAWVNAEDAASLAAGLAAVAEAAGLTEADGDPGLAVRHWLEADGKHCLVVFDDASDPDALRPYVPVAGAARVVITSNRQSLADLGELVGVGVFTPAEAGSFLTERTGLPDQAGAEELAAELGFLPLALAQAAAVIRSQRLGYGAYLERLRSLPIAGYLTRRDGQPYPHGVAETTLLSLRAVQVGDPSGSCDEVMNLASVLSTAGVRRDLLYAAGQGGLLTGDGEGVSAAGVDEALGRLAEGSLVAFALDGQAVAAHRLVLRVVRERLAELELLAGVCRGAARLLKERAEVVRGSADRLVVRDFPEQVTALWQVVAELTSVDGEMETALVRLRLLALYHLNELGDSAPQAIAVGEPLVEDCVRALGPDDPSTMSSRNNLASAYQDAGRTGEAIALHEQTLAGRERVLGPDHPDTMTSRNNLASAYRAGGRTGEAIALHEQTLAGRERVLGPDHPGTLQSRNNLASAHGDEGPTRPALDPICVLDG
jgi:hypothetical protein